MIATTPSPTTTRTCRACATEQPIENFRRNRKGSEAREYYCRDCHTAAEKTRRHRKRDRTLERFARRAGFQLLDRRLRALTAATVRKLGGVDRMAQKWVEAIRVAEVEKPGSTFVVASYCSIARMVEFISMRPELASTEPERMSDEELKQHQALALLELIEERPEVAVTAAQVLGWTVIPPAQQVASMKPDTNGTPDSL